MTDAETKLPSANLPPHKKAPILSTIHELTSDTEAAYKKSFKKLTTAEWMTNNRWLQAQSRDVQFRIIVHLTHLSVPLVNIDTYLLADILFDYMDRPEDMMKQMCATMKDSEYVFELPSGVYGILIEKLSLPHVQNGTIQRVVQIIFKNVIRLVTGECPYFSRTHVIMLYDKLRSLFFTFTKPNGSSRFEHLVQTVVSLSKCKLSSQNHPPSLNYRIQCLQTVHHAIIMSTFKMLACREHFEDIDTLFHYCRQSLQKTTHQWLSQLDETDINIVWERCPQITAYCKQKSCVFRSTGLFHPHSAIAQKCSGLITKDEEYLIQGIGSTIETLDRVHQSDTSSKTRWALLQSFPITVRRSIVLRLMTEVCSESHANMDEDALDQTRELFQTNVSAIVKLMHIRKQDLQTLVQFYTNVFGMSAYDLFTTQKVSTLTATRLTLWLQHIDAISLKLYDVFLQDVESRTNRLYPSNGIVFNFRLAKALRGNELKLRKLMEHPIDTVRDLTTVQGCLQRMGTILTKHIPFFQQPSQKTYLRLVRCLLLLEYLLKLPEAPHDPQTSTTGTPDECAICYNEVEGSLHTLPCGHAFHPECMFKLTQHSASSDRVLPYLAKCPYCMREIEPKETIVQSLQQTDSLPTWKKALYYYVYKL
mgnify:CR=1 FL=1